MKPAFRLSFGGKNLSEDMAKRVLSITVRDEAKRKGDTLQIIFDDRDESLEIPAKGDKVQVFLGYGDDLSSMGQYTVDDAYSEGPPFLMHVHAKGFDSSSKIKERRSRNFEKKSAGDVLELLAKENGLEPKVSPYFKSATVPYGMAQCKESDLHFGSRLTDSLGGTFKVNDGKLIATKEGDGKDYQGKTLEAIPIKRNEIKRLRYGRGERSAYKSAECYVRSLATGKKEKIEVGLGSPVLRISEVFSSKELATRTARARLNKAGFSAENVQIDVPGNPKLTVERRVALSGFKRKIDGEWIIHSAEHKLVPQEGYQTNMELKKSWTVDPEGDVPKDPEE